MTEMTVLQTTARQTTALSGPALRLHLLELFLPVAGSPDAALDAAIKAHAFIEAEGQAEAAPDPALDPASLLDPVYPTPDWPAARVLRLERLVAAGWAWADIAADLGATVKAVTAKADRTGILTRWPRNKAGGLDHAPYDLDAPWPPAAAQDSVPVPVSSVSRADVDREKWEAIARTGEDAVVIAHRQDLKLNSVGARMSQHKLTAIWRDAQAQRRERGEDLESLCDQGLSLQDLAQRLNIKADSVASLVAKAGLANAWGVGKARVEKARAEQMARMVRAGASAVEIGAALGMPPTTVPMRVAKAGLTDAWEEAIAVKASPAEETPVAAVLMPPSAAVAEPPAPTTAPVDTALQKLAAPKGPSAPASRDVLEPLCRQGLSAREIAARLGCSHHSIVLKVSQAGLSAIWREAQALAAAKPEADAEPEPRPATRAEDRRLKARAELAQHGAASVTLPADLPVTRADPKAWEHPGGAVTIDTVIAWLRHSGDCIVEAGKGMWLLNGESAAARQMLDRANGQRRRLRDPRFSPFDLVKG